MNKIRQYVFIILLSLTTILFGYNYFFRPFEVKESEILIEETTAIEEVENVKKTKQEVFLQLSSREKVLQMIAMPVVIGVDSGDNYDDNVISENVIKDKNQFDGDGQSKYGFFTLFGNEISMELAKNTIKNLKQNNKIYDLSPFIVVDHEGGTVQRLSGEGFSKLSSWQDVCELSTKERDAVLKQSANELKSVGIDVVLAPVLDVGKNSVLKDRVCSVDSYAIVADRSMNYTTIFSKVGILPVLKHFPGIGQTKKDLHDFYEYVEVLENDVKLYKYIIDQNDKIGVMTSHVGVVSQDSEIPCSVSPYCVSELSTAYPNVLVFTDALDMKSAAYDFDNPKVPKDLVRVSKEAVLAGNNVLIYGPSVLVEDLELIVNSLTQEYESNHEFKTYVDKSVFKIVEYK